MADIKITDLAAYTDPVSTDVLPIVDVGNDLTKKVSIADLLENAGTGSAAAPSFSFDGDSDTGIYRPGANQVALTAGGTQALLAESTGITIPGNLTVSGTTTTVDTVNLTVKDKNIELGVVSTPSNTTADGGGITLKGATDKTINWVNSTGCWTFNQPTNFNDHVRIDSSGRLLVGTSSAANNYRVTVTSYTPQVQLVSTAVFGLAVNRTNGDANISIANSSTVANNDTVGRIVFNANDGANLHAAAHVTAQVDGTPGTNDMPGRLVFSTTADGASSPTERLRIDSSGKVGIGTSAPLNALHVVGTSSTSNTGATVLVDSNAALAANIGGSIAFRGTDGSTQRTYGLIRGGKLASGAGAFDGYLAFETRLNGQANTVERLRITNIGNVGIGTTSPQAPLEVLGSTNGDQLRINQSGQFYRIGREGSGGLLEFYGAQSGFNGYIFGGVNGERLRIDSSGRVGIGTSSPNVLLDVVGTSGSSSVAEFSYTGGNSVYLKLANASNALGFIGYETQDLTFYSNNTERLRIDSTGNVGIGRTSPAQNLDVASSNNIAYALDGWALAGKGDSSDILFGGILGSQFDTLKLFTSGSERLRIDSSGQVKINQTSADRILKIISTGTNPANMLFQTSSSGTGDSDGLYVGIDGTSAAYFWNFENRSSIFGTNATERMRIDSSGNVGIGTSSPTTKLVVSNAGAEGLELGHASGINEISSFNRSTSGRVPIDIIGQTFKVLTGNPSLNTGLFQNSSGNVGIGNTSPAQKLHVAGKIRFGANTTFYGQIEHDEGSTGANIYTSNDTGGHIFKRNTIEQMRIDSSGNVDIGSVVSGGYVTGALIQSGGKIASYVSNSTAGSDQRIYVYNGSTSAYTASIHADGSASFAGALNVGNTFDAGSGVQAFGGGSLYIRQDGSGSANNLLTILNGGSAAANQVARINGDGSASFAGNVGIGTSSPSDTLHLNGATGYGLKITDSSSHIGVYRTHSDGAILKTASNHALLLGTNDTERMRIDSSGRLLVGTTTGGSRGVTIYGDGLNGLYVRTVNTTNYWITNDGQGTGAGTIATIYNDTSVAGSITVNSNTTAFNTGSDYRLKENVVDLADGITRVKQLSPKRFNFIINSDKTVDGFLAHEAQTVVPEAVTGEKDGEEMQCIDQSKLVPLLTAALQEAIAKIETLEQRLTDAGIA